MFSAKKAKQEREKGRKKERELTIDGSGHDYKKFGGKPRKGRLT